MNYIYTKKLLSNHLVQLLHLSPILLVIDVMDCKVVSVSYLARGELHGPVLLVLGEDAGVEHGRVCRVGAVAAA